MGIGLGAPTNAARNLPEERVLVRQGGDAKYGAMFNLGDNYIFAQLLEDTRRREPPGSTWPACRIFTKVRERIVKGGAKRLRFEGWSEEAPVANLLADRCAAISTKQDEREDFLSFENPKQSYIWVLKSLSGLCEVWAEAFVEHCAYERVMRPPLVEVGLRWSGWSWLERTD